MQCPINIDLELNENITKFIDKINNFNSHVENVNDIDSISNSYKISFNKTPIFADYTSKKKQKIKPWSKTTIGIKIKILQAFVAELAKDDIDMYNKVLFLLVEAIHLKKITTSNEVEYNPVTQILTKIHKLKINEDGEYYLDIKY